MTQKVIGVIGGSGLYEMEGLQQVEEVRLKTPFGDPSDAYIVGTLAGVKMVFLPRHGRGHRISPSEINFRANLYGMKKLGVARILSVSAVGSMREDIVPGDLVIVDQFFDRTRGRASTFFRDGIVAHVLFADPVCPELLELVHRSAVEVHAKVHKGGTYICMEGPQFSTRAESRIYRKWGVDVIGMTNLQEAKLAREAEICFSTIALATDYDCWHESEDDVTIEAVLEVMRKNVATAKAVIRQAALEIPATHGCGCANALQTAILTDKKQIPPKLREDLGIIIGKYL